MSIKRIFAVVAAAGLLFAGCGDDDDGSDANVDVDIDVTTTAVAASGGTTLTLVATDFQFDKTELTAAADEAVTLEITNNGAVKHNLTIEDLDVDEDADAGQSAQKSVTPAAGTYEYHCEFHPSKMTGTLTVS